MAAAANDAPPAEVQAEAPGLRWAGGGRLSIWGLKVYDARLWVAPGFRADHYAGHAFALELRYLRDFRNEDIARRSLEEMQRVGSFSQAQAAQWLAALRKAFPDVRSGDRIVGIHQPAGPNAGALFLTNGKASGAVRDAEFARLFFGIWLSERSSEPALRQALLAQAERGSTP
jgi:hypothetical protein